MYKYHSESCCSKYTPLISLPEAQHFCVGISFKNARGCLIKYSDNMIQMVWRAYLFWISGEHTHRKRRRRGGGWGWGGITALKLNGPWVPKMAHFDRCAPGHVSLTAGRMQVKGKSPLSGLCV